MKRKYPVLPDGTSCGTFDFERYSPANRTRLSGAGLRTFLNIADRWGLTTTERRIVLGWPAGSTYRRWVRRARAEQPLTLSVDQLMRISAALGIHAGLQVLYPEEEQVAWLREPHSNAVFGGRPPLALVTCGSLDGLMNVRRFLDARAGGDL